MTSERGVITYPRPPYSNVDIEPQFYMPSRFVISGIDLGPTTIVTTTVNHDYVIGQEVRLIIPPTFGCRQLNELTAYVLSLPALNQVELALNTIGGDSFTASSAATQAQILAIGDIANGAINANGRSPTGTFIPGSFINISP